MGEVIGWIAIAGFVAMVFWMSIDALSDHLMAITLLTGGREPGESLGGLGCGVLASVVVAAIVAFVVLW